MEKEYFCRRLPEQPPKGLISWARRNLEGELGGEYTTFKAERIRLEPEMQELMDNQTVGKSVWAAYCTCTACQESYYTKKVEGADAFFLAAGEDGETYIVDPAEIIDPEMDTAVAKNDQIFCPICGSQTIVIHSRELRGGRTKAIQVATLHAIDGYAVVVYWLVERTIFEYGSGYDAKPRFAYVLGERGGLTAYSHR